MKTAEPPQPTSGSHLLPSLQSLPRAAWILFFGMFLNKFGAFVVPFLAIYLTRRGCTLAEAGMAVSAYGLGHGAASLLGGYLADRLGRRQTIVLSMFGSALAMLCLSQAESLPAIVALTTLAGLTGECYRPAGSALLADLVACEQRVTAFAAMRVAFNAGFTFGPAMAGLLVGYGYFWLFAGDAVTSILFGLVAICALPRCKPETREREHDSGDLWTALRHDRALHRLLAANFCIALVFFQVMSTYGLHVTQLGFSPATFGALFSMNALLVVCCELPLTAITRRFPARRVMAAGYALAGIGFALNGIAHTLPALVACMILFTLGEMITLPVASAHLADLAPPPMRGRYLGVNSLTWAIALVIGPNLGMYLLRAHPAALWISCGFLGLLGGVIILTPSRAEISLNPLPDGGLDSEQAWARR